MDKVRITVDGAGRMKREFERDFARSLSEVADRLADTGKDKAQDVISVEKRIFNEEVLRSFRIATTRDQKFEQSRKVHNTADHSNAVDRGVPAAAYADGGPPVQALLPWVKAKMGGWSLDYDEDGGGNDPDPPDPLPVGKNTPTGPDYNKLKRLPNGTVIRSTHARGFKKGTSTKLDAQGISVGWNSRERILSPNDEFLYYRRTDENSYKLIDDSDSEISYYIPKENENVLGFRENYDQDDGFDYFLEDDLPDKYTLDFPGENWENGEDWKNKIGETFYFRSSDGIIAEHEVTLYDQGEVSLRRTSDGLQSKFTPREFRDYDGDTRNEIIAVNESNKDNLEIDQILDGVDTTDVFGTDDIYLSDMRRLRKNLEDKYGENANAMYKSIGQWKRGSNPKNGRVAGYANTMNSVFDIEAESRGGIDGLAVQNDTEDVLLTLKKLSDDFLKENHGDGDGKVRAFRTMNGPSSGSLSKQIWENPRDEEWFVETNGVRNYTTTKSNVDSIRGPLTEDTDLDIEDDVLIAVDALMHLPDSNLEREGEIHVRGGAPLAFDRNDLEFNSNTYSDSVDFLADQFFEKGRFGSFTDEQMRAISSTVKEMGKRGIEVEGDDPKHRLNAFVDEFVDRGLSSDDEKWENWASMITGEANTLEFDGYKRVYDDGWYTYDPTVTTAPKEDLYAGQSVEVFRVTDETFHKGVVERAGIGSENWRVVLEDDSIFTAMDDEWRFVGARSFDDLPRLAQIKRVKDTIDQIEDAKVVSQNAGEVPDPARANYIRNVMKERVSGSLKDLEALKESFRKTGVIGKIKKDPDGSAGWHGKSSGKFYMDFQDSAEDTTIIHEPFHGVHKQLGFNYDHYPDSDQGDYAFFGNTFDNDGNHIGSGNSRNLDDLLMGDDTRSNIPGSASNANEFPQRVIDRGSTGDIDKLSFETVNDAEDEIWKITSDFGPGDIVEMDHPSLGTIRTKYAKYELGEKSDEVIHHLVNIDTRKKIEVRTDSFGVYKPGEDVGVTEKFINDINENIQGKEIKLQSNSPEERAFEAMNTAWLEVIFEGTKRIERTGSLSNQEIAFPTKGYLTRSPIEMFTTMSQLMRGKPDNMDSPSWVSHDKIEMIDRKFPYLIEGWLEIGEPSEQVSDILEELGYDI
jgi:hypothetical protein